MSNTLNLHSQGAVDSAIAFVRQHNPKAEALVQSRIDQLRTDGQHEVQDWHSLMWPDASKEAPGSVEAVIGFAQANGATVASVVDNGDGSFRDQDVELPQFFLNESEL